MVLVNLVNDKTGDVILVESNDPYYSTFFASLEEGTGSIPSELIVPNYVIEQFPHWLRLQAWMSLGPDLFLGQGYKRVMSSLQYDRSGLGRLQALKAEAARLPLVYLSEVRDVIGFLVDTPPDWIRYVVVDRRISQKERRDHYLSVGKMTREQPRFELHMIPGSGEDEVRRVYSDFNLIHDPLYSEIYDESEKEESKNVEWIALLAGMRHNGLLQMLSRGESLKRGEVDWSLIDWEDVVSMIDVNWFKMDGRLTRQADGGYIPDFHLDDAGHLPLVAYAYAGLPLPTSPTYQTTQHSNIRRKHPGMITFTLTSSKRLASPPLTIEVDHLPLLYDRALASMTCSNGAAVVSSIEFGLGVLLTKSRYRDINRSTLIIPEERAPHFYYENDIFGLMSVIHLTVLLQVPRRRLAVSHWYTADLTLKEEDFPETIQLILNTLGSKFLSVAVATLLEYNSGDDKALLFCEVALNYVGETGFITLPS